MTHTVAGHAVSGEVKPPRQGRSTLDRGFSEVAVLTATGRSAATRRQDARC